MKGKFSEERYIRVTNANKLWKSAYVCKHARVFQGFWKTLSKTNRQKRWNMLQQLCSLESWNYSVCKAPEAAAIECS